MIYAKRTAMRMKQFTRHSIRCSFLIGKSKWVNDGRTDQIIYWMLCYEYFYQKLEFIWINWLVLIWYLLFYFWIWWHDSMIRPTYRSIFVINKKSIKRKYTIKNKVCIWWRINPIFLQYWENTNLILRSFNITWTISVVRRYRTFAGASWTRNTSWTYRSFPAWITPGTRSAFWSRRAN